MGWLIALAVIILILYKIYNNGIKYWKLTIAQVVSSTFPNMIVIAMSPPIRIQDGVTRTGNTEKLADIFMRAMSNHIAISVKGEQSMAATQRDARSILRIIHGDSVLRKLLYQKFCEILENVQKNDTQYMTITFEKFSTLLANIRMA